MNIKAVPGTIAKAAKLLGPKSDIQPMMKFYYGDYFIHEKVRKNTILFESFHGRNISDSPLYLLQEFLKTEESKDFTIYYSTSNREAHQKFVDEHHLPVTLVDIKSKKYAEVLATCQYLVNNSSFPAYFIRRKGQHYLQTWHGTPLKTLGKRMRLGIESMYNVQHNFLQADKLLFPNEFTRHVMMRDYNLEDLYTGKVAMCGYPRNSVFFQTEKAAEIRDRYDLNGLECLAYMPTWRGTSNHDIQIDSYRDEVLAQFDIIDAQLRDDQRIFVNFHPLVANEISLGDYKHILPFPADADNYEFLNAMDGLITDYSSVFFDFSVTRKPVILFIYDVEEYMHDRGTYLDIQSLPFAQVKKAEDLAQLIASGQYKGCSYADTDYERDFLQYETADNSRNALSFLFNDDCKDVEVRDYQANKDRTWQIVRVEEQHTIEQIDTICRSIDPEKQIAVFFRGDFTQEKSAFLHDNYRDAFNFVFITKTTPRSVSEELRKPFSKKVKKRLEARERRRVFADLPLGKFFRTTFAWEEGAYVNPEKTESLPCKATVEDATLTATWDDAAHVPTHLFLTNRNNILWVRELTEAEQQNRCFTEDFASFHNEKRLKEKSKLKIGLGRYETSSKRMVPAYLTAAGSAYLGSLKPIANKFNADDTHEETVDELVPSVCVLGKEEALNLYLATQGNELLAAKKAILKSVKARHDTTLQVKIAYDNQFPLQDVVLVYRSKLENIVHRLPYTASADTGSCTITTTIQVPDLDLKEIYWDLYLEVQAYGTTQHVPVIMAKPKLLRLIFGNIQARNGQGNILFPYIAGGRHLAFTFRNEYPETDTMAFKLKETAAFGLYFLLHPYWNHKRVWLVYEKFCSNAQDNGFYFFEYCMTQLPKEKAKHVFFVIDKNSPDFDNVKPYMSNVIIRFSFKHLLYCLVSKIYIASDSRSHLYVWRPKPNLIRNRILHHKIFFLQHGVTALKRVDTIFGKHGSSPMTYFLTTSRNEQQIVVQNFGYQPEFAPILGFSRWDLLEDKSDAANPMILVMPTWRPWLEEQSKEVFESSEYFLRYSSLVQNRELAAMLKEHNVTLAFFIHPKLSACIESFSSDNENVKIIEQGSVQLNQLLMRSSMLITDFSSVCWDELYMKKPVLFYHFDADMYEAVTGSYINLETDLPGTICHEESELLGAIENAIEDDFAISPEDLQKSEGWFENRDTENRKRTFEFIEKEGF
ncbi:MAG: CDP-glycerol glycerophosphotransferase family protein [Eggerthellaceae bacterium]